MRLIHHQCTQVAAIISVGTTLFQRRLLFPDGGEGERPVVHNTAGIGDMTSSDVA